jgi:GAF domain-containing protein
MSGIYPEGKQFSEADRRRLESLTRQASIAVQNIRQLRTIQARALRERMIREITEKIQAAPDVEGVLQTALRELGRAFGTTHSRVQFRMPAQFGEAAPDENET